MSPRLEKAFGFIASGHNYFVRQTTKRHTSGSEFDVSKLDSLPRVDIVYSHSNADRVPIDAFVKAGAKGIIMAGTGDGSVHEWEEPGIVDATKKGVIVIRSSRVPNGPVTESLQRYADEERHAESPEVPCSASARSDEDERPEEDPGILRRVLIKG